MLPKASVKRLAEKEGGFIGGSTLRTDMLWPALEPSYMLDIENKTKRNCYTSNI